MPSLILKTATRLMVGLILTFSVYLLMRGHNAPGGGFAAALVAGTGFALFAIAEGPAVVRGAIRITPQTIVMSGLSLALVSGFGPPSFTAMTISLPILVNVLAIADQRFIFLAFLNSNALPIFFLICKFSFSLNLDNP